MKDLNIDTILEEMLQNIDTASSLLDIRRILEKKPSEKND